jgi:hypothetical protein
VRLADAEDRVLVAAFGGGLANATGGVKVDRDHRGDRAHRAPPADDAGDRFLIHAVLQRHHEALLREVRRDQRRGPERVVGLDRDHGNVDPRPDKGLHFHQVEGLDFPHSEFLFRSEAV